MDFHRLFINKVFLLFCICFIFSCVKKEILKKDKSLEKVITENKSIIVYPDYVTKNYVLGKFDYTNHKGFKVIPKEVTNNKIYLRKEALEAFMKMHKAAKQDSIDFIILSGTRNFTYQKKIWDYKWHSKYKDFSPSQRVKKILSYSAMPSTSRHHWGADIDINNLNNSYFSEGKGAKEYNWLINNAHKFGFYQPYTSKNNRKTGYEEEKWHWSYKPLSYLYLNYYNKHVTLDDIKDFEGYEYAEKLDIIKNYVNGINPILK